MRSPFPRIPSAALAALVTLALAPPCFAAWSTSPVVNNPLCTAADQQYNPVGCSDGAGGAIYVWQDHRNGNWDLYAQRISAAGNPTWAADGVPVCTAAGDQGHTPVLPATVIADGAGGAYVAWEDLRVVSGANGTDVYMQHLSASGSALWAANGIAVASTAHNEIEPTLALDGAGGVVVAWTDTQSPVTIYGRRYNAAGTALWAPGGVVLAQSPVTCTSGAFVVNGKPRLLADGSGGVLLGVLGFECTFGGPMVRVRKLDGAGAVVWTVDPFSGFSGGDFLSFDDFVGDGAGGALAVYAYRSSGIFSPTNAGIARVSAAGATLWTVTAAPTPLAGGTEQHVVAVSDGTGGAVLAWEDSRNNATTGIDLYAQHVAGNGQLLWGPNGQALAVADNDQTWPRIASDGAAGAIVAWEDRRSGTSDAYVQRLGATGSALWTYNGLAVCSMSRDQYQPFPVSDGANGALFAWGDSRSTTSYDVYAGKVERFGNIGDPAPVSAGVRDVRNDQGGRVKVSWLASSLDADPNYGVGQYWVWRSIAPNAAQAALARGAHLLRAGEDAARTTGRVLEPGVFAGQAIFWEYVGSQPATGDAAYSYVSPTAQDSVPGSNPLTYFRVQARAPYGNAFWNAFPDSGYSADNLPPGPPAPFSGTYAAGASSLHWRPNVEPDLAGYRLYRGTTFAFVPGPGNLLALPADTGYVDVAGAPYVYKLTAVDAHGNESAPAVWSPTGTLDADAPGAPAFALALASGSPSRGSAALRYVLPVAGQVDLALFDAAGRRVRTLAHGALAAGARMARWDGRDDAGRAVSSGLYFARLASGVAVRTQRLVWLE